MYLLFYDDGTVTAHNELPDTVQWYSWPTVVKIELYSGPDCSAFRLVKGGWEELSPI